MNIKGNKDREGFDGCYAQSRAGSTVLDSFRLNGKVALVTGGAGNYGRQIAEALGEAGAITYIASRNLETLESFAGELRERGLDVTALQYDQGQEESILELRENILERSGYIDILVNNALGKFDKRDFKNDTERFAASMQVNATGIFTITKSFADVMAKRGKGSIINIASIYGMVGLDTTLYIGTDMIDDSIGDYYFHKGGMISYTRYVAGYYGSKGVRCNSISPGGYGNYQPQPHLNAYNQRTMLGRRANDYDLKGAVVFLASDASLYITGVNLPVDGGFTAK